MKYSDHCYAVTGLAFTPPWAVNAGFIVGENRTLIIDTGANYLSAQTVYGYASAVRPENTLAVLNTEQHFDHTGGNSFFQEKGIDIYGHFQIHRQAKDLAVTISEFNETIPDMIRRKRGEGSILFQGSQVANPNQPIQAETEMDLGGLKVQILLTPGHTPTNISVFVPADGVLFTGDCVVNDYLPNLAEGSKNDWQRWQTSLERIRQLKPEVIIPGHGAVILKNEITNKISTIIDILEQAIKEFPNG
jgi:glyoxylase-like metal-dependent hydrolase (beta-lactamase superfamily II)